MKGYRDPTPALIPPRQPFSVWWWVAAVSLVVGAVCVSVVLK